LVLCTPACTQRWAGEEELVFALSHDDFIVPDRAEGVNRGVSPVFWRFCPIAKTIGGRQRPSGQTMREKQRDSGAGRSPSLPLGGAATPASWPALPGCGAKRSCRSSGLRRGCGSARPKGPSPCSLIWLRAKTNAKPQAPLNHAPSSYSV
jgi:hypothetical protein